MEQEIKCNQVGMLSGGKWDKLHDICRRVYDKNGLCPTLHTCGGGNTEVKIIDNLYNCAQKVIEVGYIPYPNSDKKHQSNTIISSQGIGSTIDTCTGGNRQPKILESQLKTKNKRLVSMLDKIDLSKTQAIDMYNQSVHNDISTIKTSIDSANMTAVTQDYRIRKLTEKEYFRLMGVKASDFEKVSKNQSMSSLFHLAGDSIVTTCLMAIFGELFDIDYNKKINELVEELKQ